MKNKVNQPLRLVDGQFTRGDEVVAPEIGNREQIALLQKAEREIEEREKYAKAGVLDVDIRVEDIGYRIVCEFTCICGNEIESWDRGRADELEELEDVNCDGAEILCDKYGRWYEIDVSCAKLTTDCRRPIHKL